MDHSHNPPLEWTTLSGPLSQPSTLIPTLKQDGGLEGDFRTEPDLDRAMEIVHRDLAALYAPLDTDAYVSPSY